MPNYVQHNGAFIPVSYTPTEIDNMFKILPVSRYGDATDNPISFSVNGAGLTISAVPAFMAGKAFTIAQTTITLTLAANKLYYLYLQLSAGVPGYAVSETAVAESTNSMYIGQVALGTNGTLETSDVTLEKVTRLDNYRLSSTRRGSAIPVSTGLPTDTGTYTWPS